MPWFHNLQWKEKPPEREGARAIRRAKQNKRHLWGLSLLRPAQRTTIALQYNEHGYRLWTGLTLFIRLSIPQKEGLQAFSSSRHSRNSCCFPLLCPSSLMPFCNRRDRWIFYDLASSHSVVPCIGHGKVLALLAPGCVESWSA